MPPRDLALILFICVVWAINFLAAAFALQVFPPICCTALRLVLVLAVLLPWLPRLPARDQWGRLAVVCVCNGGLHFGFNFMALRMAGDISSVAIAM